MTLDTSRKLDGIRDLRAVVDEAVAHGDAVENHYLEIKSDVDPTTKIGAVKVAKFILGAANRLPLNSASTSEDMRISR